MSTVKTHTFNGRKYKIDIGSFDGTCDTYSDTGRFLGVYADLDTQNGLVTVIHEALHAEDWKESEERVDQISKDIGRFLWRLGYRRVQ